MQSDYYRHGFDAMINFDYRGPGAAKAATCMANIDLTPAANGGQAAEL